MLLRRIFHLMLTVGALIALGTLGFCLIENWPVTDSVYMTVITISTVGFGEMGEMSTAGRAFTSALILVSIICMACWTARVTSIIVEGDISGVFRENRMKRMAKRLNNHVIVCGSGIFARSILDLLYGGPNDVIVLSDDALQNARIRDHYPDVPVIEQSPTDELALAQANLATARYVVAATPCDVDNLLISMTCKQLNQSLFVYAFSLDGKLAGRMNKLGVDEVICPHLLGGSRVAELIDNQERRKEPAPLPAAGVAAWNESPGAQPVTTR